MARSLPARAVRAGLPPALLEDRACADVLDAALRIHDALGARHVAPTYQRALSVELRERSLRVARDVSFSVLYRQQVVGTFIADLLVEDRVLVQVVAEPSLGDAHRADALRGLAAGDVKVGLVFNFGATELAFARLL